MHVPAQVRTYGPIASPTPHNLLALILALYCSRVHNRTAGEPDPGAGFRYREHDLDHRCREDLPWHTLQHLLSPGNTPELSFFTRSTGSSRDIKSCPTASPLTGSR